MPISSILAFALATSTPVTDSVAPDLDSNALQLSFGKSYWNGDSAQIKLTIPEAHKDVSKVMWRVNGKNTQGAKNQLSFSKLAEGTYQIQARLQDSAGNQGKACELRFTVDRSKPLFEGLKTDTSKIIAAGNVSIILPFNEPVLAKGITVNGFPDGLSIRSKSAKVLEIAGSIKPSDLEQKSNIVISGVRDLAGNIADSIHLGEWSFDAKAPKLEKTAIQFLRGDTLTNLNPIFKITLPSDFTGIRTVQCNVDKDKPCATINDSIVLNGLSEGKHVLSVALKDGAGNTSNPQTHSFLIDRTAPAISNEHLRFNNNTKLDLCSQNLTIDAPNVSDIATWFWSSNGATIKASGKSLLLENIKEGALTGEIKVADMAGNISSDLAVQLQVDCTKPVLLNSSLDRRQPVTAGPLQIRVSFSEPVLLGVKALWNGTPWNIKAISADSALIQGQIPPTGFEGPSVLVIPTVQDKAGNIADSLHISFNIDTKIPQIISSSFHHIDHTSGSLLFDAVFSEPMAVQGSLDSSNARWIDPSHLLITRMIPGSAIADSFADAAGNIMQKQLVLFDVPTDSLLLASQILLPLDPNISKQLALASVAQNRNCEPCLMQLAKTDAALGDSLSEFNTLRTLASLNPQDTALQARIVRLALAFGKPEIAKTHLQSLLISKGTRVGISDDNYARAMRSYWTWEQPQLDSIGINILPDAPRVFIQEGFAMAQAGKLAEALERYRTAQSLSPSEWIVSQIGILEIMVGNYSRAASLYDSLPHRSTYAANHAISLYQAGNFKEALERIQQHADNLPSEQSQQILGILLASEGQLDSAKKQLSTHHNLHSNMNLAWIHISQGYPQQAETYFSKTSAVDQTQFPEILFGLGQCREMQGDANGAIAFYRKALTVKPQYIDVLLQLARLQSKLSTPTAAKVSLDRALVIQPELVEALKLQSIVHLQLGDTILARRYSAMAYAAQQKQKNSTGDVVAVLRFQGVGIDSSLQWTTLAIAENVNTDLSQYSDYQIVDRNNLEKLFMEKDLSQTEDGTEGAKLLGSQNLIFGSLQIQGDIVRADMRLVAVGSGEVVATASAQGPLQNLPLLARQLVLGILGLQGNAELLQGSQSQDPKVQALIAKSKAARYEGNTEQERLLANQALKLDPRALAALDAGVLVAGDSQFGKSVAVLPFHIISKQEKDSWMSKGIQEALMTDLRKIAGLQLLERSQLDALMQEHDLQTSDLVQENGLSSFDGQLGAGVVVLGSLQSHNGKIRIDARMVLIDSGKVILATSVEGREADLLLLENKLANQIADKLNIKLTDYEKQRLSQPDTTSVATLESQFSQELGKEEMQAQLQEYKESSGKLAGRIMIAASTVVTIFAGGTAFKHYMDRSDYESESNSDLASRKGDVADQSYGAMVVSVGAAIAAWVATGAFYLWDKLVD